MFDKDARKEIMKKQWRHGRHKGRTKSEPRNQIGAMHGHELGRLKVFCEGGSRKPMIEEDSAAEVMTLTSHKRRDLSSANLVNPLSFW